MSYQNAQSALQFLAGVKGAKAPTMASEGEALSLLTDASAFAAQIRVGRERLILATVLAFAAFRNEAPSQALLLQVDDASPLHTDALTRRQYRHTVGMCLTANKARWATVNHGATHDFAVIFSNAMSFAATVNVRAAKEAAQAKRDAAKEEGGEMDASEAKAKRAAKMETADLADSLSTMFATLTQRAASGDTDAVDAANAFTRIVEGYAKSLAKKQAARRMTKAATAEQLAA